MSHQQQSTRSPARRRWATASLRSRFFLARSPDGQAQRPEGIADEPVITQAAADFERLLGVAYGFDAISPELRRPGEVHQYFCC